MAPTSHGWGLCCPGVSPVSSSHVEERKKKILIGPARSNFSFCPCDQVSSQVQRSPSPRSLATACFLWPLEIVLAPRHTAAFHDSFVLNQAGPGPFATTLCSLISAHINLLDVRKPAVASILTLAARLSTASPPNKDHTRRADQESSHLSPEIRLKQ